MRLPDPPFFYAQTNALLIVPDAPDLPAQLWGSFPVAPTGPFHELWHFGTSGDDGWTLNRIWVNNHCRMRAGRVHWNMPKVFAPVRFTVDGDGAEVVFGESRLESSLKWSVRPAFDAAAAFELKLSLPNVAARLRFAGSSDPVRAILATGNRTGVNACVIRLGGEAELTAPERCEAEAAA